MIQYCFNQFSKMIVSLRMLRICKLNNKGIQKKFFKRLNGMSQFVYCFLEINPKIITIYGILLFVNTLPRTIDV